MRYCVGRTQGNYYIAPFIHVFLVCHPCHIVQGFACLRPIEPEPLFVQTFDRYSYRQHTSFFCTVTHYSLWSNLTPFVVVVLKRRTGIFRRLRCVQSQREIPNEMPRFSTVTRSGMEEEEEAQTIGFVGGEFGRSFCCHRRRN